MEVLTSLKAILHSKRANLYYLEYCRVLQKDGRVLYLTEGSKKNLYYNIPIANTTCILLGTGTSITQAAMRMLAQAGVLVGFSGGGGTPLLMGTEIEWMTPQSEYRPTEYIQGWMSFWWDEEKRLVAAKRLQISRLGFIQKTWLKDKKFKSANYDNHLLSLNNAIQKVEKRIESASTIESLLQNEATFTKLLYRAAINNSAETSFVRNRDSTDKANSFLNHGNYLAYGLAACTLWVLGIPHGFAVMHGKTRRGALVFDIADLVKDAIVLPLAFICAEEGDSEQEFRQQCLQAFTEHKALDFMFDEVKKIALTDSWAPEAYAS
jgi:CRISP-associated protein Cas1